jgi:effector-binding domain-containing protein
MTGFRFPSVLRILALGLGLAGAQPILAQVRVPTQPIDPFGQEVTLTAKPIVYVAGSGSWDKALDTLTEAFQKVSAYLDKAGLKPAGPSMTIYTSTTDTGFKFEAAVPLAEAPKAPPDRDIAIGQSPAGKVFKFVHRGTYRDMNQTYEAITNFFDSKGLDAKDLLIEEYLTDLKPTPEEQLVVNVFVPTR